MAKTFLILTTHSCCYPMLQKLTLYKPEMLGVYDENDISQKKNMNLLQALMKHLHSLHTSALYEKNL